MIMTVVLDAGGIRYMLPAPIPENDDERLASLESMNLLSTPREADIDRICPLINGCF